MKKTYQQPAMRAYQVAATAPLAASLPMGGGDQTLGNTSDGFIDVDTKEDKSLWDTEW